MPPPAPSPGPSPEAPARPDPAELDAAGREFLQLHDAWRRRRGEAPKVPYLAARSRYLALLQSRPDPQALHVIGADACRPDPDGNGIHRERIDLGDAGAEPS